MEKIRIHSSGLRGFTLTEMLVVVALIAMFAAFAVPSYHSITVQDRMASEINELSSDVVLARSSAIKHGIPVTICTSNDPLATTPRCGRGSNWNGGWIVFTDVADNQTFRTSDGDKLIEIHKGLSDGDTIIGTSGSAGASSGKLNAVTFNRIGGTADFGVLSLRDSADTRSWRRCLIVSLAGTVKVVTQSHKSGVCP